MKLKALILTIFILGGSAYQMAIANHYSQFIKRDVIITLPTYDFRCEGNANGYTAFNKNMEPIKTVVCYTTDNFERTMLHEIFHTVFRSLDETRAEKYANDLINI